jgi:hypothetical protein
VASAPQWLWWQQLCNNQHKIEEAKRHSSSQQEVAALPLNWQHQLCNSWGGSNDGNDNNNYDDNADNDPEMTTTISTTTVVGTTGINAGMNTATALHQGLMTPGKCS